MQEMGFSGLSSVSPVAISPVLSFFFDLVLAVA
jgi:hypothetical protein